MRSGTAPARAGLDATWRIVHPGEAAGARWPAERLFDLSPLAPLRGRLVHVDGPRIAAPADAPRAFRRLGAHLSRDLLSGRRDFVFARVCVALGGGGHAAASIHADAFSRARSPDDLRVRARRAIPFERLAATSRPPRHPELEGWLRLGAWVCGEPAASPAPGCAEIPLLLALSRLRTPSARRFLDLAA